MRRNLQLLFEQSHGQTQVYETTTGNYPRVNHPKIQSQKLNTQRFCIYRNKKGDLWNTPSTKIENDRLNLHLSKFGYETAPINPGMWRHQTPPLQFSLVVDNFGVKYEHQEEITHLLNVLKCFLQYI